MPMTDEQFRIAGRMHSNGTGLQAIANKLGVKRSVVRSRFRREESYQEGRAMKIMASPRPEISEAELREWNARLSARPRDLTAAIMGDPLSGFSALERP